MNKISTDKQLSILTQFYTIFPGESRGLQTYFYSQLIERNRLNNFYWKYLNKIFTGKKLSISTGMTIRASHQAGGPFFYKSINRLSKLTNFYSIYLYKIFTKSYRYRQKFKSPGEPLVPLAYFINFKRKKLLNWNFFIKYVFTKYLSVQSYWYWQNFNHPG